MEEGYTRTNEGVSVWNEESHEWMENGWVNEWMNEWHKTWKVKNTNIGMDK